MSSRRTWIGKLTTVVGAPLLATTGRRFEVDRLLDRVRLARWIQENGLYLVDAALTVLTSPLHWFPGIGHGFLALEEAANATALPFGATSNPEKAHGFDRTGFIEDPSVDQEYASFGFITAGHDSHSGVAGTVSLRWTSMPMVSSVGSSASEFRPTGSPAYISTV